MSPLDEEVLRSDEEVFRSDEEVFRSTSSPEDGNLDARKAFHRPFLRPPCVQGTLLLFPYLVRPDSMPLRMHIYVYVCSIYIYVHICVVYALFVYMSYAI